MYMETDVFVKNNSATELVSVKMLKIYAFCYLIILHEHPNTHSFSPDLKQIKIKPEILLFKNTFSSIRLHPASTAKSSYLSPISPHLIRLVWKHSSHFLQCSRVSANIFAKLSWTELIADTHSRDLWAQKSRRQIEIERISWNCTSLDEICTLG